MSVIAWRILTCKPFRTSVTMLALGFLFLLSFAQVGMLVGWCNTTSAIIRHADADVWIMAEKTAAFDYGSAIPRQRVFQSRTVPGVASAEAMIMTWNTWQRPDGTRVNVELIGLDDACTGGPWEMVSGQVEDIHLPNGVIVDELFLSALGVETIGDEVELFGRRAIVRGISQNVRTFTASPFVFTSIDSAIRYDRRYADDEVTYVLVRCEEGHSPEVVRDQLRVALANVEVLTSNEFAMRTIKYWMLETGVGITVVLTAILGFTVSIVIMTQTMYTLTNEHLSDYATLAALGFLPRQLLFCVLQQATVLVCVGILLGSAGFRAAAVATARTPLPLEMLPEVYVALVAISVGVCLAATCFAVRSVLRINPAVVFRG